MPATYYGLMIIKKSDDLNDEAIELLLSKLRESGVEIGKVNEGGGMYVRVVEESLAQLVCGTLGEFRQTSSKQEITDNIQSELSFNLCPRHGSMNDIACDVSFELYPRHEHINGLDHDNGELSSGLQFYQNMQIDTDELYDWQKPRFCSEMSDIALKAEVAYCKFWLNSDYNLNPEMEAGHRAALSGAEEKVRSIAGFNVKKNNVDLTIGVDSLEQASSFQNGTLQGLGNGLAVTVQTFLKVPDHVTRLGENHTASFIKGQLEKITSLYPNLSFEVQIGRDMEYEHGVKLFNDRGVGYEAS